MSVRWKLQKLEFRFSNNLSEIYLLTKDNWSLNIVFSGCSLSKNVVSDNKNDTFWKWFTAGWNVFYLILVRPFRHNKYVSCICWILWKFKIHKDKTDFVLCIIFTFYFCMGLRLIGKNVTWLRASNFNQNFY